MHATTDRQMPCMALPVAPPSPPSSPRPHGAGSVLAVDEMPTQRQIDREDGDPASASPAATDPSAKASTGEHPAPSPRKRSPARKGEVPPTMTTRSKTGRLPAAVPRPSPPTTSEEPARRKRSRPRASAGWNECPPSHDPGKPAAAGAPPWHGPLSTAHVDAPAVAARPPIADGALWHEKRPKKKPAAAAERKAPTPPEADALPHGRMVSGARGGTLGRVPCEGISDGSGPDVLAYVAFALQNTSAQLLSMSREEDFGKESFGKCTLSGNGSDMIVSFGDMIARKVEGGFAIYASGCTGTATRTGHTVKARCRECQNAQKSGRKFINRQHKPTVEPPGPKARMEYVVRDPYVAAHVIRELKKEKLKLNRRISELEAENATLRERDSGAAEEVVANLREKNARLRKKWAEWKARDLEGENAKLREQNRQLLAGNYGDLV
ncbi:hypothetical protein ACHAWF_013019 [Thalassiosira exigua]